MQCSRLHVPILSLEKPTRTSGGHQNTYSVGLILTVTTSANERTKAINPAKVLELTGLQDASEYKIGYKIDVIWRRAMARGFHALDDQRPQVTPTSTSHGPTASQRHLQAPRPARIPTRGQKMLLKRSFPTLRQIVPRSFGAKAPSKTAAEPSRPTLEL